VSFCDYVPNYGECSLKELIDVFIQIDDIKYTERAILVLSHLTTQLNVSVEDFSMELIIKNPTESFGCETYLDTEYGLSESYTRDAVAVRDKLIRLKKIFSEAK